MMSKMRWKSRVLPIMHSSITTSTLFWIPFSIKFNYSKRISFNSIMKSMSILTHPQLSRSNSSNNSF